MFSDALKGLSAAAIAEGLRRDGYVFVERALDASAADAIQAEVEDLRFSINENAPPNVIYRGATYATHVFARSKTAFDLATDPLVTGVLREGLGESFSMTSKRVYETRSGAHMCFHSDTALPCEDPARLDVIVFIVYLTDVIDGEWEIIEGSHLWGETTVGSRENDEALMRRPDVRIRGFKAPKGSLAIYNGRLLHRAKPYKHESFARRSLFFQVNRGSNKGEPILVETGFITPDLSDDAKMMLGFGRPSTVASFPNSSAAGLPVGKLPTLDDYLRSTILADRT